MVITDPSIHTGDVKDEDMVVTLFRRSVDDLPTDALPGTPILFRGLKVSPDPSLPRDSADAGCQMKSFKDKVKGNAFSMNQNCWVYLLNGIQPKFSDPAAMDPPFSAGELERLQALRQWSNTRESGRSVPSGIAYVDEAAGPSRRASSNFVGGQTQAGQKSRCLGELQDGQFSDISFKVSLILHR